MASKQQTPLKISLDSLGMTLSTIMPSELWSKPESSVALPNCGPESLQKSFVFVSENGGEDSSIVVLGKSSLDVIQTQSLASLQQLRQKSMAMDYQSIISSLTPGEVENKLTELLQENLRLKETVEQNSLAMKQHLTTLVSRQEELGKVHEAHKQKFIDTKKLVSQLKLENNKLKAKLELSERDENGNRDKTTQTEKDTPVGPISSRSSTDNEFAAEMLKLAEKSEAQTREIDNLQTVIGSLNRQLEPVYCNLFAGIKFEDVRSSMESPENSHRQHFLESFTHYNDKLQALGSCYAAQASRYTTIQQCLQRCSEILSERQRDGSSVTEDTLQSKELQEHRGRLIDEELKTIVERQEMIQAQNDFQKIFTHYNSSLLELESLRQERERLTSLQRGASLHDERLDEAKASFRESEKLLQQERRLLAEDRLRLMEHKQVCERERLSVQEQERSFVEANVALSEEILGMREKNDLLQRQLKLYQDDYAEAVKLQENMLADKNHLLAEIRRLQNERRTYGFPSQSID